MPSQIKEISVIMPVYNSAPYVGQAIKSILNQTYSNFEFIIINDGSGDNSEEIILSFNDRRIKYYKTENKGTAAALNFGFSKAKNTWVARIDSDDINTPNRLEKQIHYLNNNINIDVLSSWSVYFDNNYKILFFLESATEHKEILKTLCLHNPLNQSGLIMKKSIWKNAKYNEKFKFNEDYEFFFRIKDKVVFHNLPEYFVYTRISKNSKSVSGRKENIYDIIFPGAFKNLLESKGKGDHYIWSTNIAWINFFYGERKSSRSYFKKSLSLKNTIAFLATYLPEKTFENLLNYRPKYRLLALFRSKKFFKSELKKLTS